MRKINGCLLILTAVFLSCLCSCKGKKSSEPEKISFSWWGNQVRADYTLEALKFFHEKNPEIQVESAYAPWSDYEKNYEKLMESGNETDVMQINFDWLTKYSDDGNGYYNLSELSDFIELNNFTDRDLNFGMKNGKLNAIPIAFNAIVPVFDKKAFEKYGLNVPKNWNDYLDAAKIMRKDGIYPMGVGKKHLFLLMAAWFEQNSGKKIFSDNETFSISENELKSILEFFKKLYDEKVIFPDIDHFGKNSVSDGKIAGVIAWCNESAIYADNFNKKGGNAFLGDFICKDDAENSGWYLKPATMYAIKKNTDHPEAAAKLINFLLNDSDMSILQNCEKGIPASNKALTTLMEYGVLDSMEYEALMRIRFRTDKLNQMLPVMENNRVIEIFIINSEKYFGGEMSLNECSKTICSEIKDFLQKK